MPDKYTNFADLKGREPDRAYRVRSRRRNSTTVIIAPHGGGIEPGTSEIAEAIAGAEYSLYAFEGIKSRGNGSLHITSTHFDEPKGLALVETADRVVAIHGEDDNQDAISVGGLDQNLINRMLENLVRSGFRVEGVRVGLQGADPRNICNRNKAGAGVQIELSRGCRRTFFKSLKAKGRRAPTGQFLRFVNAIREVLGDGG